MPIRTHESAQSQTFKLEKDWFGKADKDDSDIHRYAYIHKGDRKKCWNFKIDLNDSAYKLKDKEFIIDQDKFVNRPDSISYHFYGNSKYWWLIAMRNNIKEPFYEFFKGRKLKIPDLQASKNILGF